MLILQPFSLSPTFSLRPLRTCIHLCICRPLTSFFPYLSFAATADVAHHVCVPNDSANLPAAWGTLLTSSRQHGRMQGNHANQGSLPIRLISGLDGYCTPHLGLSTNVSPLRRIAACWLKIGRDLPMTTSWARPAVDQAEWSTGLFTFAASDPFTSLMWWSSKSLSILD